MMWIGDARPPMLRRVSRAPHPRGSDVPQQTQSWRRRPRNATGERGTRGDTKGGTHFIRNDLPRWMGAGGGMNGLRHTGCF